MKGGRKNLSFCLSDDIFFLNLSSDEAVADSVLGTTTSSAGDDGADNEEDRNEVNVDADTIQGEWPFFLPSLQCVIQCREGGGSGYLLTLVSSSVASIRNGWTFFPPSPLQTSFPPDSLRVPLCNFGNRVK